jgi:putative holliday junction resolvase
MSLDLGDARIGIAFSDLLGIIANGYETYWRKNTDEDFNYICKLIKEKEVDTVVIGLPLNMDGTSGDRALGSKAFGEKLKTFINVNVDYMDERLSTVSAEKVLIEADMSREKRKQVVDKVAATIILQNYLDCHTNKGEI